MPMTFTVVVHAAVLVVVGSQVTSATAAPHKRTQKAKGLGLVLIVKGQKVKGLQLLVFRMVHKPQQLIYLLKEHQGSLQQQGAQVLCLQARMRPLSFMHPQP
mmetsp:Transcript_11668/g.30587  ORF Transcript_11668/g.30587 Transcript_11668/m.30587 type:complete len:102 (+) Transcript_11668:275-580(+)